MPSITLPRDILDTAITRLDGAQSELRAHYPGDSGTRQPVHTVYGGAQLFTHGTASKLGEVALRNLHRYAPTPVAFAEAIGFEAALSDRVYSRVVAKLEREPVEDLRIDFEDGFGVRPDAEEDAEAVRTAEEAVLAAGAGNLPPYWGIRIKTLSAELGPRALRTLDLFVTTLVERANGKVPPGFVVTLPKITSVEHVRVLVDVLGALEQKLGLASGALHMELMVETTQCLIDASGTVMLPKLVQAADGRCVAAHFGTYDYTASCDITAAEQRMRHPACDFAKHIMKVTCAQTGLWLSDGATNIMPVGPHRGDGLSPAQEEENRRVVHAAWRLHADDVRHSLTHGFYQGWDLHPGQLPSRYGAVYAFFQAGLAAASERLTNFVAKAAQATLVGDVFDDAATGQGLLNFFLRGINCGALTEDDALATGLTAEEVRGRSFVRILENRRRGSA